MKKKFNVKMKWGKGIVIVDTEVRKILGMTYVSASVVGQILEQIDPMMKEKFGNYDWQLCGHRGQYEIRAFYSINGERKSFCDGAGKTPSEAFFNCQQAVSAVQF